MTIKKTQTRGRPKKDYWELKTKMANEAMKNSWKHWRGRPKKEKRIEDSINTKISNHSKEISVLEKKNQDIHKSIWNSNLIDKNTGKMSEQELAAEKYSRVLLFFAVLFFVFTLLYKFILPLLGDKNKLNISEIDQVITEDAQDNNGIQLQIWYNDQNNEFVEMEKIEINENNINGWNADDEYISLIKSFYDKINNREFSDLWTITDSYLKTSDSFRTYYSSNRLSNFLDKIAGGKVYIVWIKELSSDKPNVKKYWYTIRYKVNWVNHLTEEEREMAIVNKNWKNLIWSVMCVTTWCSKMPFFQK